MTASALLCVPGAAGLVGRGVYVDLPPEPLRIPGRDGVVVSGELTEAAGAALRLCACDYRVTIVTPAPGRGAGLVPSLRHRLRACRYITVRYNTVVVWAVGLIGLEAVILRHQPSGRIIVCNASALVMVSSAGRTQ